MAAGVHYALSLRGVRESSLFVEGQSVHVGTKSNSLPVVLAPEKPDDSVTSDIASNFKAESLKDFCGEF